MAEFIRNRYRLPAVRISIRPSRSENQVRFQCFCGNEELDAREVPASALGIIGELSVTAYRQASFRLPDDVATAIAAAMLPVMRQGEPLWLIVESSGHLAVVPWERLLQPIFQVPLLRVPNFLAEPGYLSGPLRLAICLSSPVAKTPFDVPAYARTLVTAVRKAVRPGTRLHVFADAEVSPLVRDVMPPNTDIHSIVIHDPAGAERFGIGDVDRNLSGAARCLKSPWLLWMQSELPEGVDGVHFVCPGYFRRDRGALGLARSPLRNVDREWAHFVGAEEISTFLQLIGAWTVMFSPPYENVWSIGPRVVAGSLAWQRPGPVLLHDLKLGEIGEEELEAAYRFLFDAVYSPPSSSPAVMMYIHPKRVAQYEGVDGFDGPADPGISEDVEEAIQPLAWRTRRRGRSVQAPSQPPWKQVAEVQMNKLMLRLKDSDSATGRGITDALAQISSIIDGDER